jgi:superfamily II DNA or RNA helicase
MAYTLRPQQVQFENAIRDAFARGQRRVVAVAPTGFGKGVCIADMGAKSAQTGKDVLIVTNRRQIVLQLQEHCERAGVSAGIIMGTVEPDHDAKVQVASMQTLMRRGLSRMRPRFIIIDEAHQFYDAYRKLLRERFPDVMALGMTATPVGPGGARLDHFDEVVEPIRNSEVIAAGDLLPVWPYLAPSEPDMGGISLKQASQDEIGERVDACTIYGDVFAEWEPYRHMQTVVVLPSRATCNGFLRLCLARGITAKVVDGTTSTNDLRDTFSEFKASECQMLLGVDVIREGLDLPIAQCLIDLQPTHQFRVYWQKIGRIKRPFPGQESAVVIDFAGNLWRHMIHPDQDPPWSDVTNDTPIETVNEKQAGIRCPKCGSADVYSIKGEGYKCEACQWTWTTSHPFVCPRCKQALGPHQKLTGGVCPNCGAHVGSKPVRRVRMADGSMRSVPCEEVKRRKKCNADKAQSIWDKWRFIAHNTHRTLDFAKIMYHKEMGIWPANLKNCPAVGSADWKRAPSSVYPWMGEKKRKS